MDENKKNFDTIDKYISLFPVDVQAKLQEIRQVIREAAPEATERISWQMPTFFFHSNLIHFAAFKKHIGLYPGSEGIKCYWKRKDPLAGIFFATPPSL